MYAAKGARSRRNHLRAQPDLAFLDSTFAERCDPSVRFPPSREKIKTQFRYSKRMATFTGAIGTGSKWLLDKIVGVLAATGVNPNFLTFLGLVVNFVAAAYFALGHFRIGAFIIFFAGFLDILDGQVARRQNRVTAFGAFYDSTLDRYADMALYMGLLVYYSVSGRTPYVVLAAVATAGSVMVSYARARAESLIPLCKVGFMERPERLVLLIIGGVTNRMGAVLWVIAVVSTITVIDRIVFTWQETKAGRTIPWIKLPT